MVGRITDWQAEKWLADIRENVWMGLHFDNPDVAGAYNSELFGQGYARQRASMTQASNRAVWNASPIVFSGLPSAIITHVCGWDSSINGNLRFAIALPQPLRVLPGTTQSFGPQILAISLD